MRPRRERVGGRGGMEGAAGSDEPPGRMEAAEGESSGEGSDGSETEEEAEVAEGRGESEMSFEELLRAQSAVRPTVCKRVSSGKRTAKPARAPVKQPQGRKGPLELSAKKPVPFLRQVVPIRRKVGALPPLFKELTSLRDADRAQTWNQMVLEDVHRDPRFDDLSGEYKPEIFMKTYSFLETIKKKEKEMVQKQLKKCGNKEQKEKLQQLLNRMTQQEQAQKKQQKMREREMALKRQQRELAKQGKKPFFLKKSDKRRLELAEKYRELKRSGKLESFLSKKRKRNAIKDKCHLPSQKNL